MSSIRDRDARSGTSESSTHVGGGHGAHVLENGTETPRFVVFRLVVVAVVVVAGGHVHIGTAVGSDGDALYPGNLVLGGDHQSGGAGGRKGSDRKRQASRCGNNPSPVESSAHGESHSGIRSGGDIDGSRADQNGGGEGSRVDTRDLEIWHQRWIAHDGIYFPVIVCAGAGPLCDRQVAHQDGVSCGLGPVRLGF